MKIVKRALAGTMESSDIQIVVEAGEGIEIELKSSVEKQFGNQIRKVIRETLEKLGVEDVKVIAIDKGALDCTVQARVAAAAYRGAEIKENYNWEVIK
ncbi:citrate lyase acyl carrier protein [Clostridium sp. D2Q-11]|uniref:Citrate lyase acyl carrier protein n=1 Tax=Anaeromonas frigoriresistens TaxID=2683708 RepID=A0A942Z8M3_9FIRM|nr:citrate lyase acyl carrier protein [Anaeromonas frigoriresistens]MBS4538418.1 citrate lyase acyl carrier protein [Anaeromonas frigoriresistens]